MPIDKYVVKLVECLKFVTNSIAIKFYYTFLWRVRNVETWTIHYCKIPCLQAGVVATCLKFIEIWEWFHETWLPCWLRRWLDLQKNMVHPTPTWRQYAAFFVYLFISIVVCATYFCSSMGLKLHLIYDHLIGSLRTPLVQTQMYTYDDEILQKSSSSWCWWTRWLWIKIIDNQNCLESYRYSTKFVSFLFVP